MDYVTVYTTLNPADAQIIRSRLDSADFAVNIKSEEGIDGYSLAVGLIAVQVPGDRAVEARALLDYKAPASS